MSGLRVWSALGWALALAACSADEPAVSVACPPVYVVADAQSVTQFRSGPGRDLTDVMFSAGIANITWVCEYDDEGHIELEIGIDMVAARGPAADGPTGQFAYFVAMADVNRVIKTKEVFPFEVTFEGNVTSLGFQRVAGTTYYVGDDTSGGAYTIFVGFQLTRDQYDENLGEP